MIVDLVRHGETDWNVLGKLQGGTDIPLNDTGVEQAKLLSDRLKDEVYDVIYTSELQRAKKTAEEIHKHHKDTPLIINGLLNERLFGDFEGKRREEVDWDNLAGSVLDKRPPNGESINDHIARVGRFLEVLDNTNQKTLIVSHGGVIRSILRNLVSAEPLEVSPVNTSYYRLRENDGVWRVEVNNCDKHLK